MAPLQLDYVNLKSPTKHTAEDELMGKRLILDVGATESMPR